MCWRVGNAFFVERDGRRHRQWLVGTGIGAWGIMAARSEQGFSFWCV
jgi:hypothetical protein